MRKLGLVTGGAGIIGKQLCEYLRKNGHQVIPVDLVNQRGCLKIDLRDELSVANLVKDYTPDFIIHLAAIKHLSFCEKEKKLTHATNFGITNNFAKVCGEFDIHFLYFSSDYVFGNANQYWLEKDTPCPTLQYGKDKAASELIIQQYLLNYAIVRTSQLYGFAGDFVSLVRETLIKKQIFSAFANLINCPTWIGDLLPMINTIIDQNQQGIFHCIGPEALSRYQYACIVAESFNLPTALIAPFYLDFSNDIRPSKVKLNGALTYKRLQKYPNRLKENISYIIKGKEI